jgi:hypothetical protein
MLPTAPVVCWSLDESEVCCRFDGREVWLSPFKVWSAAWGCHWWHVRHAGQEYTTGCDCD